MSWCRLPPFHSISVAANKGIHVVPVSSPRPELSLLLSQLLKINLLTTKTSTSITNSSSNNNNQQKPSADPELETIRQRRMQELMAQRGTVSELEKDILDSKEKIEFYRTKMQELVLYKSRCDNRLNEITERVSADKREVDKLAKKYEDKYKQSGDVASKLTIEEATF